MHMNSLLFIQKVFTEIDFPIPLIKLSSLYYLVFSVKQSNHSLTELCSPASVKRILLPSLESAKITSASMFNPR